MLVPNQKVEVKWNSRNVRWYKEKGYEYTKTGEIFMCKVEDLMPSCKIKVKAICDYCGDTLECENVNYNRAINKKGKISCGRKECIGNAISDAEKVISYNKYLEFCKKNNYKPHTSFDDYNGVKSFVIFECEKHGLQKMSAYYVTHNDVMCHDCTLEKIADEKKLSIKNLMDIVAKEDCDLLNPNDYINSHTSNLIFQNRQCGHVYTTSLDNFKKMKHKCTECAKIAIGNTFRLDYNHVKEFIESKNNNKLISKKYESARNKLEIECGSCKNIFYSSFDNYKRNNYSGKCPNCSSNSKGETIIMDILNKYNVKYNREFKFNDCRDINPLPFDFYLPTYNKCIEFDGIHHYKPIIRSSCMTKEDALEHLKWVQKHDEIKNQYCKNNNIDLFRIPYLEINNLEKILIKNLNLIQIPQKIKYIPKSINK